MWDAYEAAGTADPDLARRMLAARLWAMRQLYSASDVAGAIDIGRRPSPTAYGCSALTTLKRCYGGTTLRSPARRRGG
jgi:hypothetical protein